MNPNSAKAWLASATAGHALKRHDETLAACEKALAIDPAIKHAEGLRFLAKLNTSDWRDLDGDRDRLIAGVHRGTLIASPFVMICATSSSQDQLKCAELFAAERYPTAAAHEERKVNGARDRINVAYVSADFGEHAVSLLTAGLFENHDRSQFRTIGISLGRDDRGKMRDRIKSSFETFIDAGERSDSEVATLMPGSIGGDSRAARGRRRPNASKNDQISPLGRRSGCPTCRQPSTPRFCLAGRPETREYSRQFGSHPDNRGINPWAGMKRGRWWLI